MLHPYSLIVAAMLALAGCAAPERPGEPPPPLPPPAAVSEETWQRVDGDIRDASRNAAAAAKAHAVAELDRWQEDLRRRTENDFIPWFSGYWTQQWLAVKLAWYRLRTEDGGAPAATRLSAYLQREYLERVLAPAAREVDPDALRAQATQRYVQLLGEGLRAIPPRHGVAAEQFDGRLRSIPAIAPPAGPQATLYELVQAEPLARQPAYAALLARIRQAARDADKESMAAGISPMARRAGDKLAGKLAASGGASAAAMVFGGVAGMMISLGTAGFGAVAHAQEQPKMEAELRTSLHAAQDDMRRTLQEDAGIGVLAGVYQIAGRIEARLAEPVVRPVRFEPVPETALPAGD